MIVLGAIGVGLLIATQDIAHQWHDAPVLGHPLLIPSLAVQHTTVMLAFLAVLVALIVFAANRAWWRGSVVLVAIAVLAYLLTRGAVYSPIALVGWIVRYRHQAAAHPTWLHGMVMFGSTLCATLGVGFALTPPTLGAPHSTAHGSAQWGNGAPLRHDTGLLLGQLGTRTLRYGGDGHLITVAPTRSGKGVSVIIPNLLTYPGSVIVTDPKGENYAVTARRRAELGTTVHAFDPFDVVGGTATYNPLDVLHATGLDVLDDARMLADMLIVVDGKETGEQSFWNEEARALLTGLILYVVAHEPPERRTLTHVRALLTLPPTVWEEFLRRMSESPAVHGLVARSAARVLQKADKERSGVISSAQSHTHFLDSPRMARVLHRSSVELASVKTSPTSCFLILPPERLDTYHRWLRLMIAAHLVAIMRTPRHADHRVVFLLDEFAHLGRMQPVARDMALVGGYGATFWIFLQDLSQLRSVYAEQWPTFLANADVLQAFGTNDWDTAEYLSKMTGDATIRTRSENVSRGESHGKHGTRQEGHGLTHAERGRRLLFPDEVRRLDPATQLLFYKSSDPIRATKDCYYRSPVYAGWYDPNPLRLVHG